MLHRWRKAKVSLLPLTAALVALPVPAAAPQPYQPALNADFPDPFVLQHDGQYLAYATNPDHGRVNVQMASSPDLLTWTPLKDGGKLHDAMPVLPAWAKAGFTWAPEVIRVGDGYVLYFTARDKKSHLQCIGAATASDPRGPFTSAETAPLVCQTDLGGSIDPDPFRDADGGLILYFKNDGNNPDFRKPTRIYAQHLGADGLSVTGEPVALLANDADWEGNVIEAPTMVRRDAGYTLFFSANDYGWTDPPQRVSPYAIGYATCRSAMGPCTAAPENPILYSRIGAAGCLSGPGHQSVIAVGRQSYIAFHAWSANPGCHMLDPKRNLYVAELVWSGGKPLIGPSVRAPVPPAP
jgi:beta-xylosidase